MTENKINNREKEKKSSLITIRRMNIDDIAPVFHLGEKLFTLEFSPNLYRTWDEYEVITNFQGDQEFCFVAEDADKIVGFLMGTIIAKRRSSWRYGYLIWLGVAPSHQSEGRKAGTYKNATKIRLKAHIKSILQPRQKHPGCSSRSLKSGLGAAPPLERGASSTFFKGLEEAGCVARESAL